MTQYSMEELKDMAAAYVLGALSTDEQAAFDRVLATSTELQQEVAAYQEVFGRIGTDNQLAPPPAVRERFLSQIAGQKAPAATPSTPREAEARPFTVSSGNASSAANAGAATNAPKRWWLPAALGLALAASLVVTVQRNSQVNNLNAALALRDSLLQARTVQLAQRDSTLNTILESESNLVLVNLVSAPESGPGVQFFWNVKEGRGVLQAFRLKPAAPGRTYQLWLIKDGKPVPSRLFTASVNERGLVWGIELPNETTGVSAIAISDEPAGGSQAPTTTPFLVGELPKASQ